MPPKKKKEAEGNAVNEYDEEAWTATFNKMTVDRGDAENADTLGAKEACEMVDKILKQMVSSWPWLPPHTTALIT
jgi:hypothetical protein